MIFLFMLLFVLLFVLPFLPGIVELIKRTDIAPIGIDSDYVKDPRFFANSFRSKLTAATRENAGIPGIYSIQLSRPEGLEITMDIDLPELCQKQNLLMVNGNLTSAARVTFDKEVFVRGTAELGTMTYLRGLTANGCVYLGKGTRVDRWIDTSDEMMVESLCNLGMSATSNKQMMLSSGCTFRRLYGDPIATTGGGCDDAPKKAFAEKPRQGEEKPVDYLSKEGQEDLIEERSLTIHSETLLRYSVKTYGNLRLQGKVTVYGSLFSEGDIEIGNGCRIHGNIFAQGTVILGDQVTIGDKGTRKSVIAKKGLTLGRGIKVYGYMATEGFGKVR